LKFAAQERGERRETKEQKEKQKEKISGVRRHAARGLREVHLFSQNIRSLRAIEIEVEEPQARPPVSQ
jgi:hypothetical protein